MPYQFIAYDLQDAIARITLNRPDVLNSFNRAMAGEMQAALDRARDDPEVRCLLISAAGRAFCAGQDLAEAIGEGAPDELGEIVEGSYNPIIARLAHLEKPVVCAVNGIAAGAGANLAFACDFVLASEKAGFVQSFAHIGLVPDSGGTWILPRLAGMAKAKALAMLGEKISAAEAEELGLIYRTCSAGALDEQSWSLACRLAKMPTKGLGLTKRALRLSFGNDLESQLQVEKSLQTEAGKTQDYREGVNAFLEKRKPLFKGE